MKNLNKARSPFEASIAQQVEDLSHLPEKADGFIGRRVKAMFHHAQRGILHIALPGKRTVVHKGSDQGPHASIHFTSWKSIWAYVRGGELAFAEAYMNGQIIIPDLKALFSWYVANDDLLQKRSGNKILQGLNRFMHLVLRDNNRSGSRKNISYHYDLGNDFYQKWLDETMTYSAADFSGTEDLATADLATAQRAKYDRMIAATGIKDGHRVLEVGCGWGGMAEQLLTTRNVSYRGITISQEQLDFANQRLKALNDGNRLANPASNMKAACVFEDYRDTTGSFDAIVSVEMFEAVGEKHWASYFKMIHDRLAPGGKASIQVITIDHERFLTYRKDVDFIQKYIFPGGMLPSKKVFTETAEAQGLLVTDSHSFGPDYAETLRRWGQDFNRQWDSIKQMGFDERFYRMWRYYLIYCEVGFDAGTIDVVQFTLTKEDSNH